MSSAHNADVSWQQTHGMRKGRGGKPAKKEELQGSYFGGVACCEARRGRHTKIDPTTLSGDLGAPRSPPKKGKSFAEESIRRQVRS